MEAPKMATKKGNPKTGCWHSSREGKYWDPPDLSDLDPTSTMDLARAHARTRRAIERTICEMMHSIVDGDSIYEAYAEASREIKVLLENLINWKNGKSGQL